MRPGDRRRAPVSRFCFMPEADNVFCLVGPTATGKSELAVAVARRLQAEIVSADAFQLYRGLPLLTAQPSATLQEEVPHHLLGVLSLEEESSAEKFRLLAREAIAEISERGRPVLVVGGSGLYLRALLQGLDPLPPGDPKLRAELEGISLPELNAKLAEHDPATAAVIDRCNRRRVTRALEICLLAGAPVSRLRTGRKNESLPGVLLMRDRDDLQRRIRARVEEMFRGGVAEEVRRAGAVGPTAEKTLGLREIRRWLAGEISEAECLTLVEQQTRRYAKRQLTWFRGQGNFESLNLSLTGSAEAVDWITRKARQAFAARE